MRIELFQAFKSARGILASAHTSLAELLRELASYFRVHDYCTSVKYLRAFVHVARTSSLASSANTCLGTATYAHMHKFVFIAIIPLLSCF